MTTANPVKGEVEVKTASATFTLCFPWGTQKAVTAQFGGKQFLQAFSEKVSDLSDDELEYLLRVGLKAKHPDLTDAQVVAVMDDIGPGAAMKLIGESVRLTYDMPKAEGADPSPAAASEPGTPTPASTSGSSST